MIWIVHNSAIHKAAGLTVPSRSMILPGTIPEIPISCEWSQQLERPPDHVLYGGRPYWGFVNSAVKLESSDRESEEKKLRHLAPIVRFLGQIVAEVGQPEILSALAHCRTVKMADQQRPLRGILKTSSSFDKGGEHE